MEITETAKAHALTVYLPDTRGVTISRFGSGNLKLGLGVFTYSRLPGPISALALGTPQHHEARSVVGPGTCPGATRECQMICYAARPVQEQGPVAEMWFQNSRIETIPRELPPGTKLVRLHVSGDFTTLIYIDAWRELFEQRPDVRMWAYTRSWRVPKLLDALERMRALPNVQLFASMDSSTTDEPPAGWRRAWIDGDVRAGQPLLMRAHGREVISQHNTITYDGRPSYVCPEETNRKANCEECRYCFDGKRNDVTFLRH